MQFLDEKDQRIKELENENRKLQEKAIAGAQYRDFNSSSATCIKTTFWGIK